VKMELNYKIKANFWKKNGNIYRNNTKLIFDDNKNDCIGTVIMLNPGDAKPLEGLDVINEHSEIYGSHKDPTLGFVATWVIEAYKGNKSLCGYIAIVNLCDIRDTNSNNLPQEPSKTSSMIIEEIPQKTPWVWIAWGGAAKQFNNLREDVLKSCKDKLIIGIENKSFMHPIEISTKGKKQEMIEKIIKVSK